MKQKILHIIITLIFLILAVISPEASPYLVIDSIDGENDFPNIKINTTVNTRESGITGELDEENFKVYEDGRRASFVNVKRIIDSEDFLYLVFSIDSSKSISRNFLRNIKSAARDIVTSTGPKDRVAIYRFNDDVIMLNSFINEKRDLIKNINSIERHGRKTLLYNAVYDSLELLKKVDHNKKAIIVFTDGKDEGSSIRESDIIEYARETSIPLYFICIKSSPNRNKLARISKLTGGRTIYSKDSGNVAGLYRKVVSYIKKSRYLLEYKSTIEPDGRTHTVEVKLNLNGIHDNDTRDIVIERSWNIFTGNNSIILYILLGIIILLLIIILLIISLYLKGDRRGKNSKQLQKQYRIPGSTVAQEIEYEEDERIQEQKTLLDSDPEYHYAHAWLIEKEGPATGKKYPIHWDECTIGREHDNIVKLDDNGVSPYHAKLKYIRNAFYIYDLVSENGTYLNGKKLLRPKTLYDWDEIKVGRTTLIFRGSRR